MVNKNPFMQDDDESAEKNKGFWKVHDTNDFCFSLKLLSLPYADCRSTLNRFYKWFEYNAYLLTFKWMFINKEV